MAPDRWIVKREKKDRGSTSGEGRRRGAETRRSAREADRSGPATFMVITIRHRGWRKNTCSTRTMRKGTARCPGSAVQGCTGNDRGETGCQLNVVDLLPAGRMDIGDPFSRQRPLLTGSGKDEEEGPQQDGHGKGRAQADGRPAAAR